MSVFAEKKTKQWFVLEFISVIMILIYEERCDNFQYFPYKFVIEPELKYIKSSF